METMRGRSGERANPSTRTAMTDQSMGMPFLIAFEALVLIAFSSVAVFNVWVALLVLWFGLHLVFRLGTRRGWLAPLSGQTLRAHMICVAGFPLVATIWKYFTWSAAMVGQLLPLLAQWWAKRPRWEQVVMAVASVAVVGNVVEVMEYLAKYSRLQSNPLWANAVYRDTMADICTNVVGAATAALLFTAIASQVARSTDGIVKRSDRLTDLASRRAPA
jgi:hypothetical protein